MHRPLCCLLCLLIPAARAAVLEVGPGQPYATPCAAIAAAADGDRVQIDAAGSYVGDACTIQRSGLHLLGVNGRPHLQAGGVSAQGKAIWVIAGHDTVVENIEFSGAQVPDRNGAGIRQEGRNLRVLGCYFHDNENGILAGDLAGSTIVIERSEFFRNGYGDGYSHNLYINRVDRLEFRFNWSHDAVVGHLLKSRAVQNLIAYNRLTGEAGSDGSYEINLPNGGLAWVIGNLIEQPASSQNGAMLDYLSEGGAHADSRLYVVNNSFVNHRNAGTFVQSPAGSGIAVRIENNLFVGPGTLNSDPAALLANNLRGEESQFSDPASHDYRLLAVSAAIDAGNAPPTVDGCRLAPRWEYRHPASAQARIASGPIDIGAYEYANAAVLVDGFEACP